AQPRARHDVRLLHPRSPHHVRGRSRPRDRGRAAAMTRVTRLIGGALVAVLGGTGAAGGQPLPVERVLPARLAAHAATAAVAACEKDAYRVAAAVADRAGVARVVVRGDGAGPHTVDSSTRKAYTAATFRQPTSFLMELSGSTPAAATLRHIDRVLLLGGG